MSILDKSVTGPAAIKVCLLVGVFVLAGIADASAQGRGGGGRGGGGRGGGGGGKMASSSVAGSSSRGGGGNRSASGANRANAGANRSGSTANRGNGNGNRSGNNVGNGNRGNINTGDVNVNRNNVNIDVDGGYGNGCCNNGVRYPVAAGMAIGAMAVTTAAVVGSYYYALPSGCSTVVMNGATYSQCGSAYYQKTWQGNDVAYVVVNP